MPYYRSLLPSCLTSRDPESSVSRSLSPVSSERFAATEKSGPRFVALTAVQTVTAPTITVHGRDRKTSPSKPSSSRDHANRKGDKKDDKKDKKKDDDGGQRGEIWGWQERS